VRSVVADAAVSAYFGTVPAVEITKAMNSNHISKAQARHVHAALAPTLCYLSRLYERLNARGFPPQDRLYRAASKAQAAMSELVMVLRPAAAITAGMAVPGTAAAALQQDPAGRSPGR
jgi:hypothetical protein